MAGRSVALLLPLLLGSLMPLGAVSQVATPSPSMAGAVLVEEFAYTPAETVIAVGGTVTWTIGDDPEQHTITPVKPSAFEDSGQRFRGDTFEVRFDEVGTFHYLCTLHPFMTGTVSVVAAAAASPAPTPSQAETPSAAPTAPATSPRPDVSPDQALSPAAADAGPGALVPLGLAAAVIAIAALLLARRRRTDAGR